MAWRGLTIESKAYCGYDKMTKREKLEWRLTYLTKAGPKFWVYTVRDWLRFRKVN